MSFTLKFHPRCREPISHFHPFASHLFTLSPLICNAVKTRRDKQKHNQVETALSPFVPSLATLQNKGCGGNERKHIQVQKAPSPFDRSPFSLTCNAAEIRRIAGINGSTPTYREPFQPFTFHPGTTHIEHYKNEGGCGNKEKHTQLQRTHFTFSPLHLFTISTFPLVTL